jgi:Site-specific DNA methylase
MGGKFAIAGQISGLLRQLRVGDQPYLEPFAGGCNIVPRIVGGVRIASDANPYLITMYKALQTGWEPPQSMTRDEWQGIKARMDVDDPLTAFAGFGCSFAGIWFQSFISAETCNGAQDYHANVHNSLMLLAPKIADVTFTCCDYRAHDPHSMLIYCDPPYIGTAGYKAVGGFDHDAFWQTMREWSKDNTVCISEYVAPPDFTAIWSDAKFQGMGQTKGQRKGKRTIETVFMHESQAVVFKTIGEQGDLI